MHIVSLSDHNALESTSEDYFCAFYFFKVLKKLFFTSFKYSGYSKKSPILKCPHFLPDSMKFKTIAVQSRLFTEVII